mmetsp:Transcript_165710/g.532047  ORF Transcript_165710/g.532047 Transcript_165710/m.532047 type:complete len:133 (-) Transcript_165710:287-685(-)
MSTFRITKALRMLKAHSVQFAAIANNKHEAQHRQQRKEQSLERHRGFHFRGKFGGSSSSCRSFGQECKHKNQPQLHFKQLHFSVSYQRQQQPLRLRRHQEFSDFHLRQVDEFLLITLPCRQWIVLCRRMRRC